MKRWIKKIFPSYERCRGLAFPSWGKYKLELWYCPRNYEIQPHSHNNVDIKLYFLFGNNIAFYRKKQSQFLPDFYYARWWNIGTKFNIKAGDTHYFKVSSFPLIFLNFETWHIKPTSASVDLQLTTYK